MASLKFAFILVGIILCIVMLLSVINLFSIGIINRTKELGILKALGAKNKDLFVMFFAESFIISAITFVISIGLAFFGAWFFNFSFTELSIYGIKLFFVDIFTIITIFTATFVAIFLATVIPLLKIRKMKPIDAIKRV